VVVFVARKLAVGQSWRTSKSYRAAWPDSA
jgi:hypothetical protein